MNALAQLSTSDGDLRWALEALLAELPSPALLVDSAASVVLGNAAGLGLLVGPEDAQLPSVLSAAANGEKNPLGLTVRAGPSRTGLLLLVAREPVDQRQRRAESAARRWSLTRRQAQVMGELVLGRGNKEIGERLTCSHKTVELHVTAILAAAGVSSRSALLSLLLREG